MRDWQAGRPNNGGWGRERSSFSRPLAALPLARTFSNARALIIMIIIMIMMMLMIMIIIIIAFALPNQGDYGYI